MIVIRGDVWDVIDRHARDAAPEEACGFLGASVGAPERMTKVAPVINTAADPYNSFEVDDREQLAVWDVWAEQAVKVRVTYHTHVGAAATMSALDVAHAKDSKMLHLILSVIPGEGVANALMWQVEYPAGVAHVQRVEFRVDPPN